MLDLGELLEDPLPVLGGDADAGVGDGKHHGVACGGQRRRHPHLAALGELQRVGDEVTEDLGDLPLVGVEAGHPVGLVEHEGHRLVELERAQHPAERAEEVRHVELRGPHDDLARLGPGEVEEIPDQPREVLGRLPDEADLPDLPGRELAVDAVQQQPGQREHRVQRRAELVAHVREEARLRLVGAAEALGLLVQLGVERDHAAVGVFQLAVQPGQLLLPALQLLEGPQQLLVLPLDLVERALAPLARELGADGHHPRLGEERGRRREDHAERDRGPPARRGLDVKAVHEAPRAHDAEAHPRLGPVRPVEDGLELGDPGPPVADVDEQDLRRRLSLHHELDRAAAAVAEGVARDLRHGGGEASLVLEVEAEQRGDLARALPGGDDIVLPRDRHGQHRPAHAALPMGRSRATTTATSSRRRLQSR